MPIKIIGSVTDLLNKTKGAPVLDGQLLIGSAANSAFNKGLITVGANMTANFTPSGIFLNALVTGGNGTVTSVAATGANGISVSGSPVNTSGTLTFSLGNITPVSVTTGNGSFTGMLASGNVILSTNSVLGVGTNSPSATTRITVGGTITANTGSSWRTILANPTYAPTGNASIYYSGILSAPVLQMPANRSHSGIFAGFYGSMFVTNNNGIVAAVAGIYIDSGGASSGNVLTAYGGYFQNPTMGTNKAALYGDNIVIGYPGISPPSSGMSLNGQFTQGSSTALSIAYHQLYPSTTYPIGGLMLGSLRAVGGSYDAVGWYITPVLNGPASDTAVSVKGLYVAPTFVAGNVSTNVFYGVHADGTAMTGTGTPPDTAVAGYFTTPATGTLKYALYGENLVIGDGSVAPPTNGALISGNVSVGSTSNTNKFDVANGHIGIMTAGRTLRVKQGANACMGTGATMANGSVTVSTTAVSTGDLVLVSRTTAAGTLGNGIPTVSIVNNTSFTLTSSSAAETSTYSWLIVKSA